MAELRLHEVHREPFSCKFGRVGVTEPVRVDALIDAGLAGEAWKQGPNVSVFDWFPSKGAEHSVGR